MTRNQDPGYRKNQHRNEAQILLVLQISRLKNLGGSSHISWQTTYTYASVSINAPQKYSESQSALEED